MNKTLVKIKKGGKNEKKMSQTIEQIRSPAWNGLYSQILILPEDLMVINIHPPNELSLEEKIEIRSGKIKQTDLKYFNKENEKIEIRKKRYPYLY